MIRSRGFTLIEMLISLAIFALIGVSAYQVLASSSLVSERELKRTEKMHQLHKAFRVVSRDLRQVVDRPVRGEFGPREALLSSDEQLLEFTRAGNENPLGQPRSGLLRIEYSLREKAEETQNQAEQETLLASGEEPLQLIRTLRRMPDSVEVPVIEQLLLGEVNAMAVKFLDADGAWYESWPIVDENPQPSGQPPAAVPDAIEISLDVEGIGEFSRVISLR